MNTKISFFLYQHTVARVFVQTLFTEQTINLPIHCKQKCVLKTIQIGRHPRSINYYKNLTSQNQKKIIRTNQSSIVLSRRTHNNTIIIIPGRCEKLGVKVVAAAAVVVVAAGVVAVAGAT